MDIVDRMNFCNSCGLLLIRSSGKGEMPAKTQADFSWREPFRSFGLEILTWPLYSLLFIKQLWALLSACGN